jgi:hypothetical protein
MRRLLAVSILLIAVPATGQDAGEGGGTSSAPLVDSHVVEKGDTLWDLCARIMNDPFAWPKVWSYNPEITNPHWIYPGDIVRFYPTDQLLPSQTELIADSREMPGEEVAEPEEPEEVAAATEAARPAVETISAPVTARTGPRRVNRFVGLFVTPKELAEAGTLTNAAEDKILFSQRDLVYVTFPKDRARPKAGERYMVYRTLGKVVHPVSSDTVGYMTQVTALASVENVEDAVTRVRLDQTVVEVERGQYLAPLVADIMGEVTPKSTKAKIGGVVLAVQFDGGVVAGEQQVIFVDKGTRDGLGRGDQLVLVTQGDPLTGRSRDMPFTEVARAMVVQVNDTASTCVVTDSRREIEPGTAFRTATN